MTPANPKPTSTGDESDMPDSSTGMTDFLNSGNANVTPYAETSETALPDWYTNYGMQLLSNQNAVMNQPYQTFQGPRVASFTPQQQQGFNMTGQAAEAYKPGMNAATQATQALMSGPGGMEAADPYLQRSAQTSASQVQQYMNPFQEAVVDRIGALGARTLREQILPEISDRFIKSGQFGGSRQAEMIGRGIRDTMEGISAQQAAALSQGYAGALEAAGADLSRYSTLGQTAGALQQGDVSSQRANAAQMANLAAQQQNLGLTGAGALQQAGAIQQGQVQKNYDVAYEDYLRQQADPQAKIDAATATYKSIQQGVPQGKTTYGYRESGATPATSMSEADKAALIAAGVTAIPDIISAVKG